MSHRLAVLQFHFHEFNIIALLPFSLPLTHKPFSSVLLSVFLSICFFSFIVLLFISSLILLWPENCTLYCLYCLNVLSFVLRLMCSVSLERSMLSYCWTECSIITSHFYSELFHIFAYSPSGYWINCVYPVLSPIVASHILQSVCSTVYVFKVAIRS